MSFASPLLLLGLVVLGPLILWYVDQQRRRTVAAGAFVNPVLTPSLAPRRPGWRRHAPMLAFAIAITALIVAAARPQRTVAVPFKGAAIMLADDISSSMASTDVVPSRLGAAKRASEQFVARLPDTVLVGQMEFARKPLVLQSPTTDHALAQDAIAQLKLGGGGTAIGNAIETAVNALTTLPAANGKRPPGAIVLVSDGSSNVGTSSIAAAQLARSKHIVIDTISLGTSRGTIPIRRGSRIVTSPVPVSSQELAEIATASGGHAYTAADSPDARSVYAHLAVQLGHKRVKQQITAAFAGGGLVLLLLGGVLTLGWFGRII